MDIINNFEATILSKNMVKGDTVKATILTDGIRYPDFWIDPAAAEYYDFDGDKLYYQDKITYIHSYYI